MRIYEISKGTVLVHSNGRRFHVDKLTDTHAHCSAADGGEDIVLNDEELGGYITDAVPISLDKPAAKPAKKKPAKSSAKANRKKASK